METEYAQYAEAKAVLDACGISRKTLTDETQYDDSIVRQMIECIKVHSDGRLTIIFGGGYEIEETL